MRKILVILFFTFILVPAVFPETVYLGKNKDGVAAITTSVQDMFVGRQIDTFSPIQIRPVPISPYAKFIQKVIKKQAEHHPIVNSFVFWLTSHRLGFLWALCTGDIFFNYQ